MRTEVNIFTAIIVLIVGLYDLAVAINRRHQPQKLAMRAYTILGIIFTLLGIYLIIACLVRRG